MIASKSTKSRTHGPGPKMQHRKMSQTQNQGLMLYIQKTERGGEGETVMKYSGSKINLQMWTVN